MKTIQLTTALLVCAAALVTQTGGDRLFAPHVSTDATEPVCTSKLVVSGLYCLINDLTIGSVEIEPNGELCTNGNTLTITCDDGLTCSGILNVNTAGTVILSGGGMVSVNGTVNLEGTALLIFDGADHTLSGTGQIVGKSNSAAIHISGDKTLTIDSLFTVRGLMTVDRKAGETGVATLKNKGLVLANGNGILELASNLALKDTGGALWKADGFLTVQGELKFSRAHTTVCPNLVGDFMVTGAGTLNFAQDIYTLGNFTCTGTGTVVGTLRYSYHCDTKPPTFSIASSCP